MSHCWNTSILNADDNRVLIILSINRRLSELDGWIQAQIEINTAGCGGLNISKFKSTKLSPSFTKSFFYNFVFVKLLRKNLLLLTLIQTFKYEAIIPFLLFIIQDCLVKPFQPILIGLLIRYFHEKGKPDSTISLQYALLITIILCLSSLLFIASHHPSILLPMKLSLRIKIIWSTLIYNNALKLNQKNLSYLVNMMTNDVRRFDEFAILFPYLFLVPIQTILILIISWIYIGPSCLATFSAFIILAYFLSILGKYIANLKTKSIAFTEKRLKILNEIFRYLRGIKIYTLEMKFISKIIEARRSEISRIKFPLVIRSINLSLSMVSSRVIMYFSFLIYLLLTDSVERFYPETVFVSIALFERLRFSLTWTFPLAISGLYDILSSCDRLNNFLFECQQFTQSTNDKLPIKNIRGPKGVFISNLSTENTKQFSTIKETNKFYLKNITLSVESNQTLSIIGPVGSGKSTLLSTILSEISVKSADRFEVNGTLSYVSQEVFMVTSTIRENILFGRKYDSFRYKKTLEICALEHDLDSFPLGDQCIVGENGFTLSGGQKARINLARALYGDADIYLMDDPFSAVDAHLARHIFQRCFQTFLRDKCVLIATHQLQFIPNSTNILMLDNGTSVAYGSFDTLMANNKLFAEFFNLTKYNISSTQETVLNHSIENVPFSQFKFDRHEEKYVKQSKIDQKLNRYKLINGDEMKLIKHNSSFCGRQSMLSLFWEYLKIGSNGLGSIKIVVLTANQTSFDRYIFLLVYTLIIIAIVIFAILRSYTFHELCLNASEQFHNRMAKKIIQAPISCFDYMAIGKMLHYFTQDVGILDETLPNALFDLNLAMVQVISIVCLIILFVNPYMIMATFIFLSALYKIRNYYSFPSNVIRQFETQIKLISFLFEMLRVVCLGRSRIFSHLSTTLEGLITIRANGAQDIFRNRFYSLMNDHTATAFLQLSAGRFFCMVVDSFSFAYIIIVLVILFLSPTSNASLIGHCLSSVFNLIGVTQWALKRSVDSDHWIMSYRNLLMFNAFPDEEDRMYSNHADDDDCRKSWNSNRIEKINMDNLSVYYQPMPELADEATNTINNGRTARFVLKNVNVQFNYGEKIGICGRNGAGKSSLMNALLRFNRHTGTIRFDGIEIDSFILTHLRRNISIIPQYPVIFTGTIRHNLDLFDQFGDDQLWSTLGKVQLRTMVESLPNGLDESISFDSPLFSLGQKQLICLARIMLQDNSLVILDEPTASVDFHTDKLIQSTIRSVFAHCTVITIAHRLDSIIDCDRILVFDNGLLVEDDSPRNLLINESSHLSQLVKQTGPKMSAQLRACVFQHCNEQCTTSS
ncbi:Multidrug resistance-associated protein 4 [Blomia tropicalis]|nr:Multidrug resistance-associated protein 4 [Blomia tropicalis]